MMTVEQPNRAEFERRTEKDIKKSWMMASACISPTLF